MKNKIRLMKILIRECGGKEDAEEAFVYLQNGYRGFNDKIVKAYYSYEQKLS